VILLLVLRLLFIWFLIRSVLRLTRGITEGMRGPSAPKPPAAVPLARDPVCGTFVVPSSALSAGTGTQMKFFCSENCRRAYANRERNGGRDAARASGASRSETPEGTDAQRQRRAPNTKLAQ
jgi:YHS domain-containing protein